MATSLIERINKIKSHPQKSYPYWDMSGYSGIDTRNQDFMANEYGAAQVSTLLVEIDAALQVWEQWLDGLVWDIKDINTGNVLFSTNVRVIPKGERGSKLARAFESYRRIYHHSYWKSLVTSDWITGETYIYRVPNRGNVPTELQWLNPLSIEPDIREGRIQGYRYSADDSYQLGYSIPAEMVAYRMMRRNIFDDLRGKAPLISIIDEANLSRNVKRAFRQYFRNGMILGGVMMPESADDTLSPGEAENAKTEIRRELSGTANAHRWALFRKRMVIEQFQTKDASKDLTALDLLRKPMMMALGVPEELTGLTGDKSYENVEQARKAWWSMRAIPYALDIAEFHNNQIVPYLEPGAKVYIEPNTAKYEIETPDVVSQDVNTGIIDLFDAASKRGHEGDKDLKGIRIIGGQPYSKDRLLREANGATLEMQASQGDSDTPKITDQLGDRPTAEIFGYHIDSGVVTIDEARAQLGLKPKASQANNALQDLQSKLAVMVTAVQAQLSKQEAAMLVGLDIPKIEAPALPSPEQPEETPQPEAPEQENDSPFNSKAIHGDTCDCGHCNSETIPFMCLFDDMDDLYDVDAMESRQRDELASWHKFERNRKSKDTREFETAILEPYIRYAVIDRLDGGLSLYKAIINVFDDEQVKTKDSYRRKVRSLFSRLWRDKIGLAEFVSGMGGVIEQQYKQAFEQGVLRAHQQLADLTGDELAELEIAITSEKANVLDIMKDIIEARLDPDRSLDTFRTRAELWISRYDRILDLGYAVAMRDKPLMWKVNPRKEHCKTCLKLDGRVYKASLWRKMNIEPRSPRLACFGGYCGCRFERPPEGTPLTKGRPPSIP